MLILLTNDDGIHAAGLKALAQAMAPEADLIVCAPNLQRSGEGKAVTYSRPLKVAEVADYPCPAFSIDGTPADAYLLGLHLSKMRFRKEPDWVLSGINSGDNTSLHAVYTSGTCAAAMEAGLNSTPAIAFSLEVDREHLFAPAGDPEQYRLPAERARDIALTLFKSEMPKGVHFLNVNFPAAVNQATPIRVSTLCPVKYRHEVIVQKDPRGSDIYWLWGDNEEDFPAGSDSHELLRQGNITVTPITLEADKKMDKLKKIFD